MNFRKLKIFYETATSLNMTEVGRKLYISQPSVSQAIKEIEIETGARLFDRIGKRLYLTYEGELYLKYVNRVLNLHNEALTLLNDCKNNIKGRIRIGASTTIGSCFLPKIIKEFLDENKNIDIVITIGNSEEVENKLLNNEVDIGFIEGNVLSKELIVDYSWKDELVFIGFKGANEKNEYDLLNRFIMREKGSGTRQIIENYLNSKNIDYKISMELGNVEAIIQLVEVGLGISCVPFRAVSSKLEKGDIEVLNIINEENIKRDFKLIYHQDKFLSETICSFIKKSKEFE
ncbi:LysR substrate-binding domain-containing protein [Clostridium sp.]|uniref:LysR substrate-binding domain-containing protein n=1 Tax=Clostridium sp. TaxID=1506 RepID=UPI0039916823